MTETVLVEIAVDCRLSPAGVVDDLLKRLPGFVMDRTYSPVPMAAEPDAVPLLPGWGVVIVRGQVVGITREQLKLAPGVIGVWSDSKVAPFPEGREGAG